MLHGRRVIAVVPARAGSKGIRDKNMQTLGGVSLIGWAARTLAQLEFLDARVISTDSEDYAIEARRFGLDAPFLRPAAIAADDSSVVSALVHALTSVEQSGAEPFDVVVIAEPTCPLRTAADITMTVERLIDSGADSAVTVSRVPAKFHPLKLLTTEDGLVRYHTEGADRILNRQQIEGSLYFRNGACYALTRSSLLDAGRIITGKTAYTVIDRPLVNIDEPEELLWAEYLLAHRLSKSC